jgi:hypothetical protein
MLGRYIMAAQISAGTMRNSRLDNTGMLSVLKSVPCKKQEAKSRNALLLGY